MGKVERFEDLVAWQMARAVVRSTYQLTQLRAFREDPSLVDQMRRSAVSSMSNVAEGFERHTRTEFAQFLKIASGSSGELRSQTYVVEDCGFAPPDVVLPFRAKTEELCRVINGLRNSVLRRREETGN